jgi:hypothetical protein
LKKQIFKIKQQLLKEKQKKALEDAANGGAKAIGTIKEEDNETDEIKTEIYLTSGQSSSSSSSDPETGRSRSRKGSRRGSKTSNHGITKQFSPAKG